MLQMLKKYELVKYILKPDFSASNKLEFATASIPNSFHTWAEWSSPYQFWAALSVTALRWPGYGIFRIFNEGTKDVKNNSGLLQSSKHEPEGCTTYYKELTKECKTQQYFSYLVKFEFINSH